MSKRRQFGAVFKAKVAVAAIQGDKTLNELAGQYEVHPNQISQWKTQAIERLPEVLADGLGPSPFGEADAEATKLQGLQGKLCV